VTAGSPVRDQHGCRNEFCLNASQNISSPYTISKRRNSSILPVVLLSSRIRRRLALLVFCSGLLTRFFCFGFWGFVAEPSRFGLREATGREGVQEATPSHGCRSNEDEIGPGWNVRNERT
jgi:hypothetical protein